MVFLNEEFLKLIPIRLEKYLEERQFKQVDESPARLLHYTNGHVSLFFSYDRGQSITELKPKADVARALVDELISPQDIAVQVAARVLDPNYLEKRKMAGIPIRDENMEDLEKSIAWIERVLVEYCESLVAGDLDQWKDLLRQFK